MTTREPGAGQPPPPRHVGRPCHEPDIIDAERLFRGRTEIVITHRRDRYVLRITRHGKLILNK